jgi:hypothetical protein
MIQSSSTGFTTAETSGKKGSSFGVLIMYSIIVENPMLSLQSLTRDFYFSTPGNTIIKL